MVMFYERILICVLQIFHDRISTVLTLFEALERKRTTWILACDNASRPHLFNESLPGYCGGAYAGRVLLIPYRGIHSPHSGRYARSGIFFLRKKFFFFHDGSDHHIIKWVARNKRLNGGEDIVFWHDFFHRFAYDVNGRFWKYVSVNVMYMQCRITIGLYDIQRSTKTKQRKRGADLLFISWRHLHDRPVCWQTIFYEYATPQIRRPLNAVFLFYDIARHVFKAYMLFPQHQSSLAGRWTRTLLKEAGW